MSTPQPSSPCINICNLDEDGYCRGCLRSREEIAAWSAMSATEQMKVLAAVERRREALMRDEEILNQ